MKENILPLKHLTMILTYACQLRCKMCGQVAGAEDAPNSISGVKEQLPFDAIKKCIDELKRLKTVYLFGGEPLLYKDIIPLLEYLRDRNLMVSFSTNGLLLERFAPAIIDTQVGMVSISLDSHNEKVHDDIRGKEGLFQTSLHALDSLFSEREKRGSKKPEVKVHLTITPHNYRSLIDYYNFFYDRFPEIDLVKFHFPRFATKSMGEAYMRVMQDEFGVSASSWQGNFSDDEFNQGYVDIDTDLIHDQITELLKRPKSSVTGPVEKEEIQQFFREPHVMPKNRKCSCFKSCGIQPNGDVVMCADYPDYVLGNIKDDSITDIWNGEKATRWRDYLTNHGNPGVLVKCSRLYPAISGNNGMSELKLPISLIGRVTSKLRRTLNI